MAKGIYSYNKSDNWCMNPELEKLIALLPPGDMFALAYLSDVEARMRNKIREIKELSFQAESFLRKSGQKK